MAQQNNDPHSVVVMGRLSFPSLFHRKQGRGPNGEPQGKAAFSAVLLIPKLVDGKPNPDIAKLTAAAKFTKQEKWQGKPVNLIGKCIRDGEEKAATDGYGPNVVFISARNEKVIGVVDRDAVTPMREDDVRLFAGCWVRMGVRCWAQDNGYGKRLNWSLSNVQYVRKGDPFGEKPVAPSEQFDALPDEEEDGVDAPSGAKASASADDGI